MNIKKKYLCILVLGIVSAVILTACESEASEDAASEETVQKYSINEVSVDDSTDDSGSEYEISDMLPKPSDDTFIMSVDEAMELMGKNPDGTDIEDESPNTD